MDECIKDKECWNGCMIKLINGHIWEYYLWLLSIGNKLIDSFKVGQ